MFGIIVTSDFVRKAVIVCVSSFVVLMTLYYRSMVVWKTSCHWLIHIQITKTRSNIKINSEKFNLIPTCTRKLSLSCRRHFSLSFHHSSHPKCMFICISFILQTFQEKVSRWTIAITWHPSSVVCKLFTFQASSPKPLGRLESNLAGMFLGWSSTKLLFFVPVSNKHSCTVWL
jgi:hypothetical protein